MIDQLLTLRVTELENREKHYLESYERLEAELRSLKARYELLHKAVEGKDCDHEWRLTTKFGVEKFCKKCGQEMPEQVRFPDKPTSPCEHEYWTYYGGQGVKPHKQCNECKKVEYLEEDKPTQTLADLLINLALKHTPMTDVLSTVEDYYSPLLQSEYQRGYIDGRSNVAISYRNGQDDGRKQAIAEMKEKFERHSKEILGMNGILKGVVDGYRRELFNDK